MKVNKMLCCHVDKNSIEKLPFIQNVYLDFYDGPVAGITACGICGQYFFYRCLDEGLDIVCRIFSFSKLNYNYFDFDEGLKVKLNQIAGFGSLSLYSQLPKEFIDLFDSLKNNTENYPMTHICVSDAYLCNGTWRKINDADTDVTDWHKHLGLEKYEGYDEGEEY